MFYRRGKGYEFLGFLVRELRTGSILLENGVKYAYRDIGSGTTDPAMIIVRDLVTVQNQINALEARIAKVRDPSEEHTIAMVTDLAMAWKLFHAASKAFRA